MVRRQLKTISKDRGGSVGPSSHRIMFTAAAVIAGSMGNAFFQWLTADVLHWPFFFDSMFTIFVGIFFGWLPGMITGLLSNILTEVVHGFAGTYGPFAVVNIATGLCAGLLAKNREAFWTFPRQIGLILLLTVVNSLLGALVVTLVYGGLTGSQPDLLVSALLLTGQGVFSAAFMARILLNLVDKGLPVMILFSTYLFYRHRRESSKGSALIE